MRNIRFCQDGNGVVYKRVNVFCDALNGESEINKKQYCYRAKSDREACASDSKEKLLELKSLLDEGLITQDQYDKKSNEILELFTNWPEMVERTIEIAQKCCFSLDELCNEYPKKTLLGEKRQQKKLTILTWKGAKIKYFNEISKRVRGQIKYELKLIKKLGFTLYFLTVYDIVSFAKRNGILYQGRGSAANSIVCYCLGITAIDPLGYANTIGLQTIVVDHHEPDSALPEADYIINPKWCI